MVDTNVFIGAFLRASGTHPLLRTLIQGQWSLIGSEALLGELTEVLGRPVWLRLAGAERCAALLTTIRELTTVVTPTERITLCRDPEDNALLEAAVGHADYIVTNDKDLLDLHPFRGIAILRPHDFLALLP